MNSKLPPKYTILFLLLFIFNANKGGCAVVSQRAPIHSVNFLSDVISIPSHFVISGSGCKGTVSGLESYQWYTGTAKCQG